MELVVEQEKEQVLLPYMFDSVTVLQCFDAVVRKQYCFRIFHSSLDVKDEHEICYRYTQSLLHYFFEIFFAVTQPNLKCTAM